MGNQTVARRVVGSSGSLNPPLPRTEWLHRNHLNQVVAVDMVKDFLTMYGTITGYSQPYNSGGSDQFQGHKDDSETGLHYNLARSYSPAVARWVSADSVTAFVYHPHSLNKFAYFRNNPIGLVDRDGHDASRADYPGDCVEVNEWLPPPLVGGGIGGNRHGVLQPFRVVDGGGSGGLGVTPVRPTGRQLLQDRLNRKNINQATPCRDFLDAL